MGKSEDFTRDRKPAPLGVTRRHILPLVGATAASAVILPRSLAAAPPDPFEKPSGADASNRWSSIESPTPIITLSAKVSAVS